MAIGTPVSIGSVSNTYNSGVTTVTLTTTATVPAGALIVVGIGCNTFSPIAAASAVSDGTNSFTRANTSGSIGSNNESSLWYAVTAVQINSGSTITVTIPSSGGSGNVIDIHACYVTGLAVSPFDKTSQTSSASASSLSTATATLTRADEISIGFSSQFANTATYTQPSGFTNINQQSVASNGITNLDYKIVAATTAITYAPAWNITGRCAAMQATFMAPLTYTLTAAAASYTLTGIAILLNKGRLLTAAVAAFALTGKAVVFPRTYKLAAAVAAYTLTGVAASLKRSLKVVAAVAAYTFTANAAALRWVRVLQAGTAVFVVTVVTNVIAKAIVPANKFRIRLSNHVLQKLRVRNPTLGQ